MQSIPRHWFVKRAAAVIGGLLLVLAIAACGESDAAAPPSTPTPGPVLATATAENGSALPLQRYHYAASFALQTKSKARNAGKLLITTEGDYESPDRHAFTYTITSGANTLRQRLVLIGDKVWLKQGSDPWHKVARNDKRVDDLLSAAFSPARPGFLGGERYVDVRDAIRRLPSTDEVVNDVAVNHYRVSQAGQEFFEAFLADEALLANVEDFRWELWLAQDGGWPVRMSASSTVTKALQVNRALKVPAPAVWELQIDISRPDDPRLAVRPPSDKR